MEVIKHFEITWLPFHGLRSIKELGGYVELGWVCRLTKAMLQCSKCLFQQRKVSRFLL